ncbi:hypothetical protein EVJ58_g5376 [Rhodofomes roseus]|uniref:Uncharacterized protein n=1 Tax=Rhodofomes roseus TaxID=34475 RepID=A0A4Y9YBZ2_9APHY|nr:hypothetical protein EVJ58_g5376 [Rhodofomes roseus]
MATTLPNYAPYNISLTDQSAIVRFFPHRDGLITDNWNVTYTDSNFADWSYNNNFGSGISQMSAHRTVLVGAYVVIDWAGTAVFLYGTSAAEYTVQVDGQPLLTGLGADGLLFSQTDLAYGLHTAVLTVNAGELCLANATVTVGMGETGTVLQQRNISAVDTSVSPATANPTFIGDTNEWSVTDLYTNQTANGSPCIITSTYGSTLAFSISEAVGFVLYGSDDWAQGLFTVSVTSDNFGATSFITDNSIQYSPRALWTQLDLPKYMATGLDRTATYDVVITNLGANFNLASVVVYDAIPSASVVDRILAVAVRRQQRYFGCRSEYLLVLIELYAYGLHVANGRTDGRFKLQC